MKRTIPTLAIAMMIALMIFPVVLAQDIEITKQASKTDGIAIGDALTVTLTITNNLDTPVRGEVFDLYPRFANVEGAEVSLGFAPGVIFNTTVLAGESETFAYTLSFDAIPLPLSNKESYLGTAEFRTADVEYESENVQIRYAEIPSDIKCNFNGVCDDDENYDTCFQDCLSGRADNYCDKVSEGTCDPDCPAGEDRDCIEEAGPTEEAQEGASEEKAAAGPEEPKILAYIIIGVVVLLIIAGIIIVIIIRRRRDHPPSSPPPGEQYYGGYKVGP